MLFRGQAFAGNLEISLESNSGWPTENRLCHRHRHCCHRYHRHHLLYHCHRIHYRHHHHPCLSRCLLHHHCHHQLQQHNSMHFRIKTTLPKAKVAKLISPLASRKILLNIEGVSWESCDSLTRACLTITLFQRDLESIIAIFKVKDATSYMQT